MVDIHAHILPGLDDGSDRTLTSLRMADLAVRSGVTDLIATPHSNQRGRFENYASESLTAQFQRLKEAVHREKLDLRLHLGMEVYATSDMAELYRDGKLLTLAGSRYLLIEFPFDIRSAAIADCAEAVSRAGLVPVIAHPERYFCVQWTPELVRAWAGNGWLLQLNRGSLTGGFGAEVMECARWIAGRRLAHLSASDAHSPLYRTPDLREGYRWVSENCAAEYAELLFRENPRHMISDQSVAPFPGAGA